MQMGESSKFSKPLNQFDNVCVHSPHNQTVKFTASSTDDKDMDVFMGTLKSEIPGHMNVSFLF